MPVSVEAPWRTIDSPSGNVYTLYDRGDPDAYYSRSNVPLMLVVMSIRGSDAERSTVTLLSPDARHCFPLRTDGEQGRNTAFHWHNYFEMMFVLEGSMVQCLEGHRLYYLPGSACLTNRNTLHAEKYDTDFSCLFIAISPETATALARHCDDALFPEERRRCDNLIMRFLRENTGLNPAAPCDMLDFVPMSSAPGAPKAVKALLEQMALTMLSPTAGASYEMLALLCRLFERLCDPELYRGVRVQSGGNADQPLLARVNQLLERYDGRISNRELAARLNYSGSHIGRVVKKNTGKSLYQYAMTFTMKRAAQLLLHSDASVSSIAETLRFSNRTQFYRAFEAHFHTTPVRFRKQARP